MSRHYTAYSRKRQDEEVGGQNTKVGKEIREVAGVATSAFDVFSQSRYDKLWRISVLRLVVSFLFRIPILCLNAHGIWCLVAGQQKLQRHWQLPPLVSAVVLPIKSSGPICTRSSCVRSARNVASALRPLPNRSRKCLLFVRELLQSLGNGQANERKPRRNRSRQRRSTKRLRWDRAATIWQSSRSTNAKPSKRFC